MTAGSERRDQLRSIANRVRAIPGERFGLRPYTVAVRTGQWNGSNTGRGAEASEYLPITEANGQPPKVRQLSTEELALGNLGKGSLSIGPITPDFTGGGTSIDAFKPALDAGQTMTLLITGPESPDGALYELKSVNSDHALHYTLQATPVGADQ